MLDMFYGVLRGLWVFVKYPLYFCLFIFAFFIALVFINIIFELLKGKRFKSGEHNRVKKHGILRRILIDCPHQFVLDLFEREPDFFKYQGLIIFEGRQRSWKDN